MRYIRSNKKHKLGSKLVYNCIFFGDLALCFANAVCKWVIKGNF